MWIENDARMLLDVPVLPQSAESNPLWLYVGLGVLAAVVIVVWWTRRDRAGHRGNSDR